MLVGHHSTPVTWQLASEPNAVRRLVRKTARRDARKLADLQRAGLLTEVRPLTPEEEAVRDLCRARDDVRKICSSVVIA